MTGCQEYSDCPVPDTAHEHLGSRNSIHFPSPWASRKPPQHPDTPAGRARAPVVAVEPTSKLAAIYHTHPGGVAAPKPVKKKRRRRKKIQPVEHPEWQVTIAGDVHPRREPQKYPRSKPTPFPAQRYPQFVRIPAPIRCPKCSGTVALVSDETGDIRLRCDVCGRSKWIVATEFKATWEAAGLQTHTEPKTMSDDVVDLRKLIRRQHEALERRIRNETHYRL